MLRLLIPFAGCLRFLWVDNNGPKSALVANVGTNRGCVSHPVDDGVACLVVVRIDIAAAKQ